MLILGEKPTLKSFFRTFFVCDKFDKKKNSAQALISFYRYFIIGYYRLKHTSQRNITKCTIRFLGQHPLFSLTLQKSANFKMVMRIVYCLENINFEQNLIHKVSNIVMVKDFTVLSSDESKLSIYSCTVSSTGPSSTK